MLAYDTSICVYALVILLTCILTYILYPIIYTDYASSEAEDDDTGSDADNTDLNLKNKPKLKQNLAKKKTLLSVLSRPVIKSKTTTNNTTTTNTTINTNTTSSDNKYIYIEREKTARELIYEEAKSARILERSSRKPRTHGYLYTYNTTTGII